MKFVGADLHKKNIAFGVVEKVDGKLRVVRRERLACRSIDKLESFFKELGKFQIVVEATIGYNA